MAQFILLPSDYSHRAGTDSDSHPVAQPPTQPYA